MCYTPLMKRERKRTSHASVNTRTNYSSILLYKNLFYCS
jgi:hypothetical protein